MGRVGLWISNGKDLVKPYVVHTCIATYCVDKSEWLVVFPNTMW